MPVLVFIQLGCDPIHHAQHALYFNLYSTGLGFLLFQPEDGRKRMCTGTNHGATAGLAPFSGHGRTGSLQALLSFHEQDTALLGLDNLCGLSHGRGIHEVLCIHELLAGFLDNSAQVAYLLQHLQIHHAFRHLVTDRLFIAGSSEIARQRLFAYHVLACHHSLLYHLLVSVGRRTDVYDIYLRVVDHIVKAVRNLLKAIKTLGFL